MHNWLSQTSPQGIRDAATEDFWEMQAWTAPLDDETDSDKIEYLEDSTELSDEMEDPMDAFVTRCHVIKTIADETTNATAIMMTE